MARKFTRTGRPFVRKYTNRIFESKDGTVTTVFIRLTAVGAYSRWAFIRGWALTKFSPFSASVVVYFTTKQ